jgi:signal transduction histidine kinase
MGPVKITAEPHDGGLRLQVHDLGCGMDEATVRKAVSPFFRRNPPAKREWAATPADDVNKGLQNQPPDHGTVVTITCPISTPRFC